MLLGQLAHTAFCGNTTAILSFLNTDAQQNPHVLHRCVPWPSLWLLMNVTFYVAATALFAVAGAAEPPGSVTAGYAMAVVAWSMITAAMLLWTTVLTLCGRTANVSGLELRKMLRVAPRSVTTDIGAAQEIALPVRAQCAVPTSQRQGTSGLFKFEIVHG